MAKPRTLTDRDIRSLLHTANYTLQHGRATLTASPASDGTERRFVLNGPSGTHSLLVSATDAERLNGHWQGFCSDTRNAHIDERLISPTDARLAALEASISKATGLPIQITIRGPQKFTFSTDDETPDLEDRIRPYIGGATQVETIHDGECGSFCYVTA